MIKRILPFVLVVAVLFSVMTMPVSAAESTGYYVDILDFCSSDNSFDNFFNFSSSGSALFNFTNTLGDIRAYSVKVYATVTSNYVTSGTLTFGSSSFPLTVTQLAPDYFCFSADDIWGLVTSAFYLNLYSNGSTYITFHNFYVFVTDSSRVNAAATVSANPGTSAVLSPGGSVHVQGHVNSGLSVQDVNYNITITKDYWNNYNYIEFCSSLYCLSIKSIACISSNGNYLPIDHSFINSGSTSIASWNYISGSIDLTNIDPSYDGDIYIRISAIIDDSSGLFYVDGLQTVVISGPIDSQIKWYQSIFNKISSIHSTLTSFFNNLSAKLTSYFNNVLSNVSNGFTNVVSKLNSLIKGTPVDEGVTDDMQQSENELGNMTDQMDQLSPTVDVGDVNVNIDDFVDADSTAQVSNVLAIITNQPIIVSMLSILAGFALMGYVFFGKR